MLGLDRVGTSTQGRPAPHWSLDDKILWTYRFLCGLIFKQLIVYY